MLKLKNSVKLRGLKPEMLIGHDVVRTVFNNRDYYCMITSANDSSHGHGSLHFGGSALDYRTKHIADQDKQHIVDEIKANIGSEFDVLLEGIGTNNEHLHVEYQPK